MPDRSAVTASDLESFRDPQAAVDRIAEIYAESTARLRRRFQAFVGGEGKMERVRACYPYVCLRTDRRPRIDSRLSYGFVPGAGVFGTTVTRPDLFGGYYREQFEHLLRNHDAPIEVGLSDQPIPLHFAFGEGFHVESDLAPERLHQLSDVFDLPDLMTLDDNIVNASFVAGEGEAGPLALFTAQRVDYSLHRLKHYTATAPEHFQSLVLFTNYQFYIEEFVRIGHEMMAATDDAEEAERRARYTAFVEPGEVITTNANLPGGGKVEGTAPPRLPQMPAYHLKRADGHGITMVNIGVGPSNAKTITDHLAVLRSRAWLMLGHCAGLRDTQELGDYVLAHAYVREDHVLDEDLPTWVPIPALAEVQQALEQAVGEVAGASGYELKKIMRTGTVATIDNRNWELRDYRELMQRLSQSRAIALDMESATVAANGFRFRVPYGTLLCVSDKPLHGELKLPGMAHAFYRERVGQHLTIGIRALELLGKLPPEQLHSRKLRTFVEPAFQ